MGFVVLRLDLTGDRVGMGSLIYCMEVIARAVSWMRYGLTGSWYCHYHDLVAEVIINVLVELLYVVVGVRWCGLYVGCLLYTSRCV